MTIAARSRHLLTKLVRPNGWADDLRDYYKVDLAHAKELGQRRAGRRPSFPGSATTAPVSGKTFEEIWDSRPRGGEAEIFSFYQEIGAWAAFRQCYYHRYLDASRFLEGIPAGGAICEYGGGVGPVIDWIVRNVGSPAYHLALVDVPSEHLTFGEWRIKRKIARLGRSHTFEVRTVAPGRLPLEREYDAVLVLEVYEHLPNPVEVTHHLLAHLRSGGRLWENYVRHDHAHGADLEIAQVQRDEVFHWIQASCDRISGESPEGEGTRCWIKR